MTFSHHSISLLLFDRFIFFYLFFYLGKGEGNFHKVVLNDEVEKAYTELRDFILNELEKQQAQGVFVCLTKAADTK